MALNDKVKKRWEKVQSSYDHPVDTLGRPIDPKDEKTLKVWKEEGIDRFIKR